jgi:hypothetical protein
MADEAYGPGTFETMLAAQIPFAEAQGLFGR